MDYLNLNAKSSLEVEQSEGSSQHQYLPDLTLIHEKFVELWFKHINYFESHSGQLPTQNIKFIDGLNFVECCFLQNEMVVMADVVTEYVEQDAVRPRDFYTEEYDMKAQVSAYMNYIDQRLTYLHRVDGLLKGEEPLPDFIHLITDKSKG